MHKSLFRKHQAKELYPQIMNTVQRNSDMELGSLHNLSVRIKNECST